MEKERTSGLLETIFFQSISLQASDHFDKSLQNYVDCIKLEALFNSQNGRYSPFICLMALAHVLELPSQSIYPETGSRHAVSLLNALIQPREMQSVHCIPLNLMWSVCAQPKSKKAFYNPDHIVPIFIIDHRSKVHSVQSHQLTLSLPKLRKVESISQTSNISIVASDRPKTPEVHKVILEGSDQDQLDNRAHFPENFNYDVGSFYSDTDRLSRVQKYEIVKKVWKPESNFQCPNQKLSGRNRKFHYELLKRFSWLCYSKCLNGGFCLTCVLFGRPIGSNASKLNRLMKSPFYDWSCASRVFQDHESKSEIHKTAMVTKQNVLSTLDTKQKSIDLMHNKILDQTVSANRAKLVPIGKTVLLCGRQNIQEGIEMTHHIMDQ